MRITSLCKPAGAVAITTCAVATGIAVNLSILSAGPDGAGSLSVGTQRATTTVAPPARADRIVLPPLSVSRVVMHLAPPPVEVAAVTTPTTNPTTPTSVSTLPFDGGGATTSTVAPPSTTTTTAPTTTTTVPTPPPLTHTYAVAHAGVITTEWVSADTIVVTATASTGWQVVLVPDHGQHVKATFSRDATKIVWSAYVMRDGSLRVEVNRYVHGHRTEHHEHKDAPPASLPPASTTTTSTTRP